MSSHSNMIPGKKSSSNEDSSTGGKKKAIANAKIPATAKAASRMVVKKVAGAVGRYLPRILPKKNESPFSPFPSVNLAATKLIPSSAGTTTDFNWVGAPSIRETVLHQRSLPTRKNLRSKKAVTNDGKKPSIDKKQTTGNKKIAANPYGQKKAAGTTSKSKTKPSQHLCYDPSCPECPFDSPFSQDMELFSQHHAPSDSPFARDPTAGEIDDFLDDIDDVDVPLSGKKKPAKNHPEIEVIKVVKSKVVESEEEVQFLGVRRPKANSAAKRPPASAALPAHKQRNASIKSEFNPPCKETSMKLTSTQKFARSHATTITNQQAILSSIKQKCGNKKTTNVHVANTLSPAEKEIECIANVERSKTACRRFKRATGMDLAKIALDNDIGSWDFGAIDWWAHDRKCMPGPGESWKTEHLLAKKQYESLGFILGSILEKRMCPVFVNIFAQGDFNSYQDCHRCNFEVKESDKIWFKEGSSFDMDSDGDALEDGDFDAD